MKVFFKYVLRSMTEKKGRFFLLIIAISISTALLVASTGMINIILDSFVAPQLEAYEHKEIAITSTDESATFFSDEGLDTSGLDQASIVKEFSINAMLPDKVGTDDETMLNISIRGRDAQYVNRDIITQGNLDEFTGAVCVISERTSKEHNWKIGDKIDLIIGGVTKNIKVTAISGNAGVFYNDTKSSFSAIIPYEYISSDFDAAGKFTVIFANSSEGTVKESIDKFNNHNTLFTSEKLYDEETTQEQFASFKSLLYMLMIVVVALSSIIIYSSFKLIITERLSTIGTFLSAGATVGKVKFILYLESFSYGVFGAIVGNGFGIGALYVISRYLSPLKAYGIYGKVEIEPYYIISGFIFAVILSLVSSYLPVRRISKLQVKDIILNDVRISKSIGWKKFIIGTILMLFSFVVYFTVKQDLKGYAAFLIVISLTGVILAYPKLVDLLSRPLFKLLRGRSKSVVYAINNLRTSKVLLGNISLIIISLVSIITIVSLGNSMIRVVTDAYTKLNFDIQIEGVSTLRANDETSTADYLISELKKLGVRQEQINPVMNTYGAINNATTGSETMISAMGVDIDRYTEFNEYLQLDKKEYADTIDRFKNADSGVIITTALSKISGKNEGDTIEIKCNGLKKSLKISGVIDGMLFNNGYFVIMKNSTMKEQYGLKSANSISFSTDKETDAMMKDLKPILRDIGASATTRDEMRKTNVENNQIMVKAMSIFAYMAIIIASLGIVNNVSISFLQRKSEFAVLSSVGMEDFGRRKILVFESIASVVWAMAITSLYCIFELKLLSIAAKAAGFDMVITLDYASLPGVFIAAVVIVLVATLPACFRSRKLSIIQEIKYE